MMMDKRNYSWNWLVFLSLTLASSGLTATVGEVSYDKSDYGFSPTNLLKSNVLASSTIQVTPDGRGRVNLSLNPTNPGSYYATNFALTIPKWDDVRTSMSTLSSPSSQPGRELFVGGTVAYAFSPTVDEQVYLEIQIPHGVDTNNAYGVRVHVHFSGIATPSATSNVVWGLEYVISKPDAPFPLATTTIYATNGLSVATNHVLASFSVITNIFESSVIVARFFRDADNPADTYSGDAYGLSIDAHIPRRQLGSSGEYGDY